MSTTPALLSTERLAEIATWAKTLQGPRSGPAHVRDGQMLDEMLAHIEAREKQVATELANLHQIADALYQCNGDFGPLQIEEAAERLGFDPATLLSS